jgi:hypothetical protein
MKTVQQKTSPALFLMLLVSAIVLGICIAWVDTRTGWDDTGITAVVILCVAGVFGYAMPKRAWVWGIAVGVWIPVFNIVLYGNYSSIPSVIFAFVGAYAGLWMRKMFGSQKRKT